MKINVDNFLQMSNSAIETWTKNEISENIQAVMDKLKQERTFYKTILDEDYRGRNPKSFRYEDAEKKITKINSIGKKLSELLTQK